MALAIASRCVRRGFNRSFFVASARLYSSETPHIDPHKGKVGKNKC